MAERRDSQTDVNQQPGWQAVVMVTDEQQTTNEEQRYEDRTLRQIHMVRSKIIHTHI